MLQSISRQHMAEHFTSRARGGQIFGSSGQPLKLGVNKLILSALHAFTHFLYHQHAACHGLAQGQIHICALPTIINDQQLWWRPTI